MATVNVHMRVDMQKLLLQVPVLKLRYELLQGFKSMAQVNVHVNLEMLTSLHSTVLTKSMPIRKPSAHARAHDDQVRVMSVPEQIAMSVLININTHPCSVHCGLDCSL